MTTVKEQKAKDAIQNVFTDTSVPPSQTKAILQSLIDEIEILIDSIDETDED